MALDPLIITFVFSDGTTHDASISEISNSQQICFRYGWSITPEVTFTGIEPNYTIEVSNNNVDWSAYSIEVENADITQPFDDTHFNFLYVRINYVKGATTTGSVKFQMILKP
jgi:hypothetical protein